MRRVRPEHRLLALTLPLPGEGAKREIVSLCRQPLDWSRVLEIGHRLGALPLLGEALAGAGAVYPDDVRRACQQALTRGMMRLLVATRAMQELRSALGEAELPFMVLKGLPLASEIYPHPGLRPVGDLDLLVPGREADRALALLAQRGLRPPARSLPIGFFRRHHFHVTLVPEALPGLPVELHWDTQPFFSLSRIPEEDFWDRARTITIEGVPMRVPGREESFLYLAQHLMRHVLSFGPRTREDPVGALLEPGRRGRLAWIADLALMARSGPGLDWGRVERLSRRWGLDREIGGLRAYLRDNGVWPEPAESAGRDVPAGDRDPWIAVRIGDLVPVLSRPVPLVELRPILALRLLRFACPGSGWIRWRYGLPEEGGRWSVAWRALRHATRTMGRAARMASAILVLGCRDWLARQAAPRQGGAGPAAAGTRDRALGVRG